MLISTVVFFFVFSRVLTEGKIALVGLLLGLALASHIQALPFALATLVYCIGKINGKKIRKIMILISSFIAPLIPYIISLILAGNSISPNLRIPGEEYIFPNLLLTITSVYRFYGTDYFPFIPVQKLWQEIAIFLLSITLFIRVFMYSLTVWSLRKKIGEQSCEVVNFIFFVFLVYFPISLLTNMANHPQEYMMTWWFFPVAAPILIFRYFPRKISRILLITFLTINISIISFQYIPRLIHRTGLTYPHGPSWRMIENLSDRLCQLTVKSSGEREITRITITQSPPENSSLLYSLTVMIAITHPECVEKIRFSDNKEESQVFITPHKDGYSLEVFPKKGY